MGFSVSSAGAIIFISLFVTFGIVYTAMSNSTEKVNDAEAAAADEYVDQTNTDVSMLNASYNASNATLSVDVRNAGSAPLKVPDTELIVDNDHVPQSSFDVLTVDGRSGTDLWLPDETLHIEVTLSDRPDRVLVATEHGITAVEVV